MRILLIFSLISGLTVAVSSVFADINQKSNFDEILESSLTKSEELRSKESELRSADAGVTRSQFRFLPDLSLVGTYAESGATVEERRIGRTYGVQSNLNLFRFGGDYFNYKSSDLLYDSAQWDLQSTRISLEEVIATKILDVIARYQESEIRRKLFQSQKTYSSIAEQRYSKGILAKQELDKLKIDTSIAEARLRDAELASHQALENLKIYSGEVQVDLNWPWLVRLQKSSTLDFKFTLQNHPQWQVLKKKSEATDILVSARKSELWPSLDLNLSYLNQSNISTNYLWAPQWGALVTLTIPLYNRNENSTALTLAREARLRTELGLEKAERELQANWKMAERDFKVQLDSAKSRDQTLKISRSLYHDNLQRFQTGRTSANELFNDQDRLYQTELLAIQGWYAAHLSFVKLCHSLGLLTAQCQF